MTEGEQRVPDPRSGWVAGINRLMVYTSGKSVGRARSETGEWDVAGDCLLAIVAAAASVEATVGEFLAYPKNQALYATEIEEWRKGLPRPHDVIKVIIRKTSGRDVGTLVWYDRMRCLFELRNSLVHYRPQIRAVGTFPEELGNCVRKRALIPGGDDTMDWTSRVLVPEVAAQAGDIAQAAIHGFLDEVERTPQQAHD